MVVENATEMIERIAEQRFTVQLRNDDGEPLGPPCDVPALITKSQLELLCNNHLQLVRFILVFSVLYIIYISVFYVVMGYDSYHFKYVFN